MLRTWTNRRATPSYCLCLLSPGLEPKPHGEGGTMELQQTSDLQSQTQVGSGFWASTLNPHWCQEQDRQFSQEQELGQTTESTRMDVVTSRGLPGRIFLSHHLSPPSFRLPERFHLHTPGRVWISHGSSLSTSRRSTHSGMGLTVRKIPGDLTSLTSQEWEKGQRGQSW